MNRNLLNIAKVNKVLYKIFFNDIVKAEAFTTEQKEFKIIADGDLKNIKIFFSGDAKIVSRLPQGYSLYVGDGIIRIRNIMGYPLPPDNVLFTYQSGFFIKSVEARSWFSKKIRLKVEKYETTQLLSLSETKFEDSTLIFSETKRIKIANFTQRGASKNNIVTGLYTNKPFANGYTGYYHYFPKEKLYMTGKYPSKASKLLNKSDKMGKNFKDLAKLTRSRNLSFQKKAKYLNENRYNKSEEIIEKEVSEKKRLEINPKTRLNLQSPLNKEGLGGRLKEIKSMISESAIKKGGY